jgi:para-aminobenzoate synthetase component 1
LRSAARPDDRALWLRFGTPTGEVFCACPAAVITRYDRNDIKTALALIPVLPDLQDLPFRGGLAGFVSYEPEHKTDGFPGCHLGLYPHFIVIDHDHRRAEAVSLPGFADSATAWEELLQRALSPLSQENDEVSFTLTTPFTTLTSRQRYFEDFAQIQNYLHSGDCYQVNYAQAFRAHCQGTSSLAMQKLLEASQARYAAFLALPEGDVLSLSPELFLRVENRKIITKPIKGTAPRSSNALEDIRLRDELQSSAKNRAENLMIVDLLRHDIGQHAETGSVRVEKLFEVESLPNVHHLVSTISGQLKQDSHTVDLLFDAFPGGSITGAPKKRAMEIIAELEPTPRSIYCGSIGFINADGDALFNIAIRTLLRQGNEITAWAGGGIVADSVAEQEYQECFDKMGALMKALEDL